MESMTDYKGLTIEIRQDAVAESPRNFDNLGSIVAFHSKYALGDPHEFSLAEAIAFEKRDDIIALPLYLFDHGGLTVRTTPFDCQWDSGKIGFIYLSHEKAKKELGWQRLTTPRIEQVKQMLLKEVDTLDQYLRGDVYGFVIKDKIGEHLDSCWGFYGQDACIVAAQESADYIVKTIEAPALFVGA